MQFGELVSARFPAARCSRPFYILDPVKVERVEFKYFKQIQQKCLSPLTLSCAQRLRALHRRVPDSQIVAFSECKEQRRPDLGRGVRKNRSKKFNISPAAWLVTWNFPPLTSGCHFEARTQLCPETSRGHAQPRAALKFLRPSPLTSARNTPSPKRGIENEMRHTSSAEIVGRVGARRRTA